MANAYHMDALRKQRVIDRKNEALRRMMNAGSEDFVPEEIVQRAHHQSTTDGLVTTDMGQYNQVRGNNQTRLFLRTNHEANLPEDKIYAIIHPVHVQTEPVVLPPRKQHFKV